MMIRGGVLLVAVVAAAAMAATASAQGKPSQGCAPGFDLGAMTLAEGLLLPRTVAALNDGVATVEGLTAGFEFVDNNDDGVVCFKAPFGSFNANPNSLWQYIYVIVDNDASVANG